MIAQLHHRTVVVDGVTIFYRESVPVEADAPTLLLLHGFPSASHRYRRLMDALGSRYRLIAPDYPGFGHSEAPLSANDGGTFVYSFDHLAQLMGRFVDALGLERLALYLFDFGAPIGLRLATKLGSRVTGLIVQNGNAYDEGLSDDARTFVALAPEQDGAIATVDGMFSLAMTRGQYEGGTTDPSRIAPDGWTLDQHFLDLPGRRQPQRDLAFDYKSNLTRYSEWHAWLQQHQPPTLIVWGRNDPFFTEAGAHAYLRHVPKAELHLFETGHFALEECLPQIAPLIGEFMDRL